MGNEASVVKFTINGTEREYPAGTTLEEMAKSIGYPKDRPIVAAIVDDQFYELTEKPRAGSKIRLLDIYDEDGNRVYTRSLSFILVSAVKKVFPQARVRIEHSLSNGLYCEMDKPGVPTAMDVKRVEEAMRDIVSKDMPFVRTQVTKEEAIRYYEQDGQTDKAQLIHYRPLNYFVLYECGGIKNYFYGFMTPSTGYIDQFALIYYPPGFVAVFPRAGGVGTDMKFMDRPKHAKIFKEAEAWARILECDHVSDVNTMVEKGKLREFIRISEALHEKKLAEIANDITSHGKIQRLILICGPSSSGKTTFAQRLMVHLSVLGKKPVSISLDNYYKNRDEMKVDADGILDLESVNAIDLDLFNRDIEALLQGREVEMPVFNFKAGKREYNGTRMQLNPENIVIVEGIHTLNTLVASSILDSDKYRIYISPLTHLNLDDHNRIPTTDVRLIRRIVRDSMTRGASAELTLEMWPGVRKGEEKYIFPFQENADIMFNSSLPYELFILKKYVYPLLEKIKRDDINYPAANRLVKFLNYILSSDDDDEIPPTSILREFIGNSCFYK